VSRFLARNEICCCIRCRWLSRDRFARTCSDCSLGGGAHGNAVESRWLVDYNAAADSPVLLKFGTTMRGVSRGSDGVSKHPLSWGLVQFFTFHCTWWCMLDCVSCYLLKCICTVLQWCFSGVKVVFTELHVMQTRYSDENSVRLSVRPSVCLSVCLSYACIVTKRKKDLSRFLYHTKDNLAQFTQKKNGWWGRPLLPEIVGQPAPVGAKLPILNR